MNGQELNLQRQTAVRAQLRQSIVRIALLAGVVAAAGQAAAVELVPEAAVRVRSTERWQMLVAGKFEDAYKLLAPGFRAVQSYLTYSSKLASTAWTDGQTVRVECNDERDKCVATVRAESKVFMPGMRINSLTTFVHEKWIWQDGSWWLVPEL